MIITHARRDCRSLTVRCVYGMFGLCGQKRSWIKESVKNDLLWRAGNDIRNGSSLFLFNELMVPIRFRTVLIKLFDKWTNERTTTIHFTIVMTFRIYYSLQKFTRFFCILALLLYERPARRWWEVNLSSSAFFNSFTRVQWKQKNIFILKNKRVKILISRHQKKFSVVVALPNFHLPYSPSLSMVIV